MLFAHLKRILNLTRLRLRGPNGAKDEFLLAAIAQNLRKLRDAPGPQLGTLRLLTNGDTPTAEISRTSSTTSARTDRAHNDQSSARGARCGAD